MAALLVAIVLIAYPNIMALLSDRRSWDQWHAFMLGNALLSIVVGIAAAAAGLLPAAWGRVTGGGLLLAAATGVVPLAVILALMFVPGQLGRDIIASGIGHISTRRFVYRLAVQVALTTVVCEEFLFRGVLFVLLQRIVPIPWTVLCDGLIFGLWHTMLQYNGFPAARGTARLAAAAGGTLVYALLGVVLAWVRAATGGVAGPIVAHGVLDICMFAGMFARRQFDRAAGPRQIHTR